MTEFVSFLSSYYQGVPAVGPGDGAQRFRSWQVFDHEGFVGSESTEVGSLESEGCLVWMDFFWSVDFVRYVFDCTIHEAVVEDLVGAIDEFWDILMIGAQGIHILTCL